MALPVFHEVLFPPDISYGSSGGPGFNTTVIELASGAEQRNINWSLARATYDAAHGVKTREQMDDLLDFFWARRGKAYGFRFKDWMDFTLERQAVGQASAIGVVTNLQVYKRYEPETDFFYDRPLKKIVTGSVQIWHNNILAEDTGLDPNTGLYSIDGLEPGTVIEIACEFHVPVRFDIDDMKITHDAYEQMSWPSIPLVELRNV